MLELSGLYFSYKKNEPLFENLNISLLPGNIYGLLGKNGAGKTTLLKTISGLVYPDYGTCRFNGNAAESRIPKVLEEIYFLPENSYLPQLKADEYLKIYSPFYPRFNREKFLNFLDSLEVSSSVKLSGLSYGQRKKFSIAFALAANTSLLLLDEPTNGLDIPAKSIFRKIVASSITDEKLFIVSTHQVKEMKNLIDPIMILDRGQIIFNEPVSEIEKRFTIKFQLEKPSDEECLFYESSLGGYVSLSENKGDYESEIDIELLFNAVISNAKKVNAYFKEEHAI